MEVKTELCECNYWCRADNSLKDWEKKHDHHNNCEHFKKAFVQIGIQGCGHFIERKETFNFDTLFPQSGETDLDEGDTFLITEVWMSEKEFINLPEFTGF